MLGLDREEARHEQAGRLLSSLDEMGFGEWRQRECGGGCRALACDMPDGSYVLVTGDDLLGWFCDPEEFGTVVTVGVYSSEESYIDADEPLLMVTVPLAADARTVDGIATAVWGVLSTFQRCCECGAVPVTWEFDMWDGFIGENVTMVVCDACASLIRMENDGTVLVRLGVAS